MKNVGTLFVLAMLAGCASVNTSVTDFYAVEGGCSSEVYYLAEAYKYQAPNKPVNDRVTTYEYVCKNSEDKSIGNVTKTAKDFKLMQSTGDPRVKVIFIPESQAKKMGFKHLFKH